MREALSARGNRHDGSSAICSPIGGRLSGEAGVRISSSFLEGQWARDEYS
jgi:hypothetical protein